jgi:prepilin-type N-terminal cleavage/methylation domain-containing protein
VLRRAVSNNRGFSLIELLVAMFIIAISMMALLSSILTGMSANLQNDMRDTAIRITNATAEAILSLPQDDAELSPGSHTRTTGNTAQDLKGFPQPVQSIRGTQQTYTIGWVVAPLATGTMQVTITVALSAPYKGNSYTNTSVIYSGGSL